MIRAGAASDAAFPCPKYAMIPEHEQGGSDGHRGRKTSDVRLVWFIYPETRTAEVFTGVHEVTVVDKGGALDGGDVLPGFSLSLKKLFDRAGRRQATVKAKSPRKAGRIKRPNSDGNA